MHEIDGHELVDKIAYVSFETRLNCNYFRKNNIAQVRATR